MNFRTTFIILLVLASIAGAYVLFFEEPVDKASVNEKPPIHQVYALAKENIQQVRLSYKVNTPAKQGQIQADEAYQALTLVKDAEGNWQLTTPFHAHADSAKVNEMLEDFVNKRVKQTLEVVELAQYGLDTPSIEIALWTDSGTGRAGQKTFHIGKKAINYSVYAKEKSEAHIFLIESSTLDDLTKSPTDLRDRAVIKFTPEAVSEIQLQKTGAAGLVPAIRCEKSGNTWTMTHPLSVKADTQEIESLLSQLSALRVSTFEADGADATGTGRAGMLEKYGLEPPRIQFTLTDGHQAHTLNIGSKVAGTLRVPKPSDIGRVYVKSAQHKDNTAAKQGQIQQGAVYTVTDAIYTLLNKSVFDLRDKRILDFQRTDTTRFEIQQERGGRAEKVVCTKRLDGTWELQQYNNAKVAGTLRVPKQKLKADATAVDDLLFGADSLEAVAFVTENREGGPDSAKILAQYGLEPPAIQVAFTQRGEEKPAVLHIGNYYKNDTVYVKASHKDNTPAKQGQIQSAQVARVKRDLIDKIATGTAWLRDKQVLNFSIDDAIRLTLLDGDVVITCQRPFGTNWRLISPVKEDANNAEVNAIIYELDDLKVEAFVPKVAGTLRVPKPFATTGLNLPIMQLTVELRNQKVYTLQVGKTDSAGRFYARLQHEPNLIFLLNAEIIPKLKTTLAHLRTPE